MQNFFGPYEARCPMFTTTLHTFRYTSIALIVLLIAGCKQQKPTYSLKPLLPRTAYDQLTKKTETGEVTVRCATCSRTDLHVIFGKTGDVLLTKQGGHRITPIQIYIENNSSYTWSLSPYDIRLPLADIQEVKNRFACSATTRGLTSFTMTGGCGIILAGLGAAASIFHPVLGASIIGAGCSLIFIAPVRSHHKTAHLSSQNMHFAHIIDSICLGENVIVHPREQISKLIFVQHTNKQDSFILRLCNNDNPDHTISYSLYFEKDGRN